MLRDPILCLSVSYLEGSCLNNADLARAKVEASVGVFLMTFLQVATDIPGQPR